MLFELCIGLAEFLFLGLEVFFGCLQGAGLGLGLLK